MPTALALLWRAPGSWGDFAGLWGQTAVVTACIGGAVQALYTAVERALRARAWSPGPAARVGAHAGIVLVGTAIGAEGAARLLELGWGLPAAEVRIGLLRIGGVVSVITTSLVLLVEGLRARILNAELREERAQRAALLAELRAVQARTQPHFLFNALNVVASLIEEDPAAAERVLERLSSLFRYALTAGRRTTVPLRDELTAVHDYLTVEGVRFAERLAWSVEVGPEAAEVPVPPFVLQPLVENAVQHGLGSRTGPGRVTVVARCDGDELHLVVEDDGVGPEASTHQGNGTALRDLRERLALLYGGAAGVTLSAGATAGTRVEITLPRAAPEVG